jgi:hypothetical protein
MRKMVVLLHFNESLGQGGPTTRLVGRPYLARLLQIDVRFVAVLLQ